MLRQSDLRDAHRISIYQSREFGQLSGRPRHPNYFSRWILGSTVLVPPTCFCSVRLEISAPTTSTASRSHPSYRLPRPLRHARHPLFHPFLSLSQCGDALFLLLPSRRRRAAGSTLPPHRASPTGTAARCHGSGQHSSRWRPHSSSSSSSNTTTTTPLPPGDARQRGARPRVWPHLRRSSPRPRGQPAEALT